MNLAVEKGTVKRFVIKIYWLNEEEAKLVIFFLIGNRDIVDLLIVHCGANVNQEGAFYKGTKQTPLDVAARKGKYKLFERNMDSSQIFL